MNEKYPEFIQIYAASMVFNNSVVRILAPKTCA